MRNLAFVFFTIGISCICLSNNYSIEATTAKIVVLVISLFCLVYGVNSGITLPTQKTSTSASRYIDIISKSMKDIDNRPEVKATLFHQMATVEASVGNYKSAISCYLKALKYGADEDTIDDQIWETFRKQYAKSKDEDYVKNYFDWVPFGAHHSEANALLIGHYE